SPRSSRPMVAINCSAVPPNLLEAELFGHARGSFTGAVGDRAGSIEEADGSTLFLDEVGDMPMNMQAKLLRVLESGEVVRLGDNEPRHVDVRLISATNRDLAERVKAGEFREDLYFRIKGAEIRLPPLRERREDIPLLARHFLQRFAEKMDTRAPALAEDTQRALMQYDWPGNVRQLANVVQNMAVIAEEDRLEPRHLPPEISEGADGADKPSGSLAGMSLEQIEKQAIRDALRLNDGNREKTARQRGIGERTLYRKLKEYGVK
ncbi:MAG: sigma-54 dependent transcriptional regulator, partial [Phycisphaeraceae bacterium]|nr:sigma-54 dependent transcriptional regulator [Phycisphaeraceae bacterium]